MIGRIIEEGKGKAGTGKIGKIPAQNRKTPLILITGIFVMNTHPPRAICAEFMTSLTACSILMIKRVIFGSVSVTGPPFLICSLNIGITDPFEPSTLSNRVDANNVFPSLY